jgi:hypothetical protein
MAWFAVPPGTPHDQFRIVTALRNGSEDVFVISWKDLLMEVPAGRRACMPVHLDELPPGELDLEMSVFVLIGYELAGPWPVHPSIRSTVGGEWMASLPRASASRQVRGPGLSFQAAAWIKEKTGSQFAVKKFWFRPAALNENARQTIGVIWTYGPGPGLRWSKVKLELPLTFELRRADEAGRLTGEALHSWSVEPGGHTPIHGKEMTELGPFPSGSTVRLALVGRFPDGSEIRSEPRDLQVLPSWVPIEPYRLESGRLVPVGDESGQIHASMIQLTLAEGAAFDRIREIIQEVDAIPVRYRVASRRMVIGVPDSGSAERLYATIETLKRHRDVLVASPFPVVAPKPVAPPDSRRLSNAKIIGAMRQNIAAFKACERKHKTATPELKGKVIVRMTIGNDGRVTNAEVVTPEFKQTVFGACVVEVIRGIRFPRSGGDPAQIDFPFSVR